MRQRCPATATRVRSGTGRGAVAAQVGVLAGGVVAADQQMMNAGVGVVFGQQPKPGPGVQPWAVRPGAGGVFLPGVCRYQRGQRIDTQRAGVGGHAPVGRDRQHIAQAVTTDGRTQPGVGAIDFIAGHPRRGNPGGHGAVDQLGGQCGFGGETLLSVGDSSIGTAVRVVGPAAGKVEGPVDQSVPARGGIGQIHRDLGVLDPAGGAAVLALHPDTVDALLHVAGLVDHQDRAGIAEGVDDVLAQIIADLISVPAGAGQQVLQPVRGGCRRGARRSSSNSCGPSPRPSRPSVRRHAAAVRSDEIAARSGRSPPRTPTATDQGLRYEPR